MDPTTHNRSVCMALSALVAATVIACAQPPVDMAPASIEAPPSIQRAEAEGPTIVTLDPGEVAALRVETYRVDAAPVRRTIEAPGVVEPAPEHFAFVSAPISGRIVELLAHEGEVVRKGQVIATLESIEYAELVAAFFRASAAKKLAETQAARTGRLVNEKISARGVLERTEAELETALAEWQAAYARLKAVGVSDERIDAWTVSPDAPAVLPVYAPISGRIEYHGIHLGQSVTAYEKMLTIVNPIHLLVRAFISPSEAADAQVGDPVRIADRSGGSHALDAKIYSINPVLDETNKSVVINIHVDAPDGWPIPGEVVSAMVESQVYREQLIIPLSALQYEGDRAAVFVKKSDTEYEKREVVVGRVARDTAEIVEGLQPGDEVAVSQVFNLKAKSRFDQYGEE